MASNLILISWIPDVTFWRNICFKTCYFACLRSLSCYIVYNFIGGHTKEMLSLISFLGSQYTPRYYIMANTDQMSNDKVTEFESSKKNKENNQVCKFLMLLTFWIFTCRWLNHYTLELCLLESDLDLFWNSLPLSSSQS